MPISTSRIKRGYTAVALVVFNTLIAVLVLGGILVAYLWWKDQVPARVLPEGVTVTESGLFHTDGTAVDNGKRSPSNLHIFDYRAYEGVLSEVEIAAMLDEIYDHSQLGFAYQPYAQYSPRLWQGEYLNIGLDDMGQKIRHTTNPAPASGVEVVEIFTFGGSTTFGSGVPDHQTWSSYLSQILNDRSRQAGLNLHVEVVNYGRVGFYPAQELHLLIDILRGGARPEMVIFLDGVNIGRADDTPRLTPSYRRFIDEAQLGPRKATPLERFSRIVRMSLSRKSKGTTAPTDPVDRVSVTELVARFVEFRRATAQIAELYGAAPLFFLQPDGHYNYPDHLYGAGVSPTRPKARARKEEFYTAMSTQDGFIDLTGLFSEWGDRKAIIDAAHYSPNFSKFVAEKIAQRIDLMDLMRRKQPNGQRTGVPRQ